MYQLACKISPDENQIVTNEWTITVNWIDLTSFQEISGNGERRTRAWNMRTRSQETQLGTWLIEGALRAKEKKGAESLLLNKKTAIPFCHKVRYKLRDTMYRPLLLLFYSYYLSIFVGKLLDTEETSNRWKNVINHPNLYSSATKKHARAIFPGKVSWNEMGNITREKLYTPLHVRNRDVSAASIFIIVRNHRSNNAK